MRTTVKPQAINVFRNSTLEHLSRPNGAMETDMLLLLLFKPTSAKPQKNQAVTKTVKVKWHLMRLVVFNTSSSAIADKPARRAASRLTAKF